MCENSDNELSQRMSLIGNIFTKRQSVTPMMLAESDILAATQMSHSQFDKMLSVMTN